MKNKFYTYYEYLRENIKEVPETYVKHVLSKLRNKIIKMFSDEKDGNTQIMNYTDMKVKKRKDKGGMSLKDLGLTLDDENLDKFPKIYDNFKIIFSDEDFRYDLIITIDLKDAVPQKNNANSQEEEPEKDFSDNDIKKCQLKFKKYDTEKYDLKGEIIKTVDIKSIDEDLLIKLKVELDEEYGSGEEEKFKIEV